MERNCLGLTLLREAGGVGTGRDEVLELVKDTINWQSSRLPLLRGCSFPPLVLEGVMKQEFEAESSEDTGPSRWYLNGDQEKERGTRSVEVQCKGCSSGSLMTWMDPGYFASNLTCALGEVTSFSGFLPVPYFTHWTMEPEHGEETPFCGSMYFKSHLTSKLSLYSPKGVGDFMDQKSPGFITEGCQKGNLGPQAINETQKSIV